MCKRPLSYLVLCCLFLGFEVEIPKHAVANCRKALNGTHSLFAAGKAKGRDVLSLRLMVYHPTPGRERRAVLQALQNRAGAFWTCFETQKDANKDLTFALTVTQGGKVRSIQRCTKVKQRMFSRCLQGILREIRFSRASRSGRSQFSVRFVLSRFARKKLAKIMIALLLKKHKSTPPHHHHHGHLEEKTPKKAAPPKKNKATTQPTSKPHRAPKR